MDPIGTVEKPWTMCRSAASGGMLRKAGTAGSIEKAHAAARPRRLPLRFDAGAGGEDLLDLELDLLEVHELPVYGREADVSDLVEHPQPVHHHLADLAAGDLGAAAVAQLGLDLVDDRAQP